MILDLKSFHVSTTRKHQSGMGASKLVEPQPNLAMIIGPETPPMLDVIHASHPPVALRATKSPFA